MCLKLELSKAIYISTCDFEQKIPKLIFDNFRKRIILISSNRASYPQNGVKWLFFHFKE